MVPVVFFVSVIVFVVMRLLPGDPILALTGLGSEGMDPEAIAHMRKELGLDDPVSVQFGRWFFGVLHGDLGNSTRLHQPVTEIITSRAPATVQLALSAWLFGIVIGVPAGVIAAVKRNSFADVLATLGAMVGIAMPSFWMGILAILLFAVILGWLPSNGFVGLWEDPLGGLRYLILPAVILGLHLTAAIMRQTRSAMLEVLSQDYVRTARAKGLAELKVIGVHGLKNALLPVVTVMGLQLGRLLGGTVIIETMFAVPGLGRTAVQSIQSRDYAALQGVVLVMAVAVLVINLLTDLLYARLDPRISYR